MMFLILVFLVKLTTMVTLVTAAADPNLHTAMLGDELMAPITKIFDIWAVRTIASLSLHSCSHLDYAAVDTASSTRFDNFTSFVDTNTAYLDAIPPNSIDPSLLTSKLPSLTPTFLLARSWMTKSGSSQSSNRSEPTSMTS